MRFGPATIGAIIGLGISLVMPGINTYNAWAKVIYHCVPILLGFVAGAVIEARLRAPPLDQSEKLQ